MKPHAAIMNATELILIAALSGAGAYAFYASSAFNGIRNYGTQHSLDYIPYLPLIIWAVTAAFGVLNIVVRNRGSGSFIWLVMIFSLPSLLGQNAVDWPGILGADFKLTTSLGFTGMAALGILIITGYVILDYFRFFKQSEHNLADRGATASEIDSVSGFSYSSLLLAAAGAVAATVLVAFLARNLELAALDYIRKMPWNVVFIGLFCFLLLAFYLYWLSARRRDKTNHNPDDTSNTSQ